MKILLIASIFLVSLQTVLAQKGKIRGVTIDESMGEPMMSATVLIKGTTNGSLTDLDGNFEIEAEPGFVDLIITYLGYQTTTIENVEIKANEVTVINKIFIKEKSELAAEIVVTAEAIRANEVSLINLKLKSAGMLDGISSDKINQIGDANVAEATKRITGVTVEGGKYVYVRGLGDRYSKTTLNGVDIPGLDPDKNTIQMDIFPTNMIQNVVINKNFSAELPADFTGGLLNIETKDFPDRKTIKLSLGTSYNPNFHFNPNYLSYQGGSTDFLGFDDGTRALPAGTSGFVPTPYTPGASDQLVNSFIQRFSPILAAEKQLSILDLSLSFSMGNQIQLLNKAKEKTGKKLGYIFSLSYKSDYKHYDNVEYGDYQRQFEADSFSLKQANIQTGTLSERSYLLAGIAGLAYKTQRSKLKFTVMHLQNAESRAGKFNIINNADAVGQSGYEAVSDNLEYNQRSLTNVLLAGKHSFKKGDWNLDWKLSPTYSSSKDPDIRKTSFSYDGSYNFAAGEAGNPNRIWRSLSELNATAKVDVTKNMKIKENELKIKFGASHTFKNRDYNIKFYELRFEQTQSWDTPDANLVLAPENIFPNAANSTYIQSGNATPNPNEYNSNVQLTAAYASANFNFLNKLKTIIGLRSEYFVMRHTGRDIAYASGNSNGNNLVNEKVLESINLFPSVNLVYSVTPKQNIRTSYSRTIARPSFKEQSYAQILDPITNRIFNGSLFAFSKVENGERIFTWNGNLKETNIDNFDIRWELFLKSKAQFITASFFFKNFTNPIELVRIPEQQTSVEYQTRNVGNGRVFGAEVEFRKNFDFISPLLENLYLSTNVTYVYSEITMTDLEYNARKSYERTNENISQVRDMAGQSPFVINCGIDYKHPDLGMTFGIYYNVKGPTLMIVGTGLVPDIYSEPFHSLNFSYNQQLGKEKNTSFSFKVSNMLNDARESLYRSFGAEKEVFNRLNPGVSFSLGFSHKFK